MIQVYAVTAEGFDVEVPVRRFVYPGGEVQISLQECSAECSAVFDRLRVDAHVTNSDEVMALLLVTDAIQRTYPGLPISLQLPYVPYARQDRVANPGEALSLRVFTSLINTAGYSEVVIEDPHSDVTTALLDRVKVRSILPALHGIVAQRGPMTLVAPDAGARKRVFSAAKALGGLQVVCADKIRDTLTGAISGTVVPDNLPPGPMLVVDDICDGGWTFIALAGALKARYAAMGVEADLSLYITHGIFSKGVEILKEHYTHIYTRKDWTNSGMCIAV